MVELFSRSTPFYMVSNVYHKPVDAANIVVVDDEQPIAYMVADLLTDEGYGVEVYHDGASALRAICARPPQLVLLDMAMPIMGGEELLLMLRDIGFAQLPIIMMSADTRLPTCIEKGANAIIPKPFELTSLLECVAQFCGKKKAVGGHS